jgi:hypothetical protein
MVKQSVIIYGHAVMMVMKVEEKSTELCGLIALRPLFTEMTLN